MSDELLRDAFYLGWMAHHKAGNPPMAHGHVASEAWEEYRTRLTTPDTETQHDRTDA